MRPVDVTHIVLQALNELDAVVAEIKLPQVAEALQTLYFSDAIALVKNKHKHTISTYVLFGLYIYLCLLKSYTLLKTYVADEQKDIY